MKSLLAQRFKQLSRVNPSLLADVPSDVDVQSRLVAFSRCDAGLSLLEETVERLQSTTNVNDMLILAESLLLLATRSTRDVAINLTFAERAFLVAQVKMSCACSHSSAII